MFLKTLNITNFRNYSHLTFHFKNQITVLIGDNAQGKSNFLEAIYFLASSKSPKADKDEELIKQADEFLRIEGEIEMDSKQEKTSLEIAMQMVEGRLKKKVKVNGIARRVGDYVSNLAVVLFAPEDVNLVTGSPSLRRNHLDQLLSQIDREYKKSLTHYENVVSRKNRILKAINEGIAGTDQLMYWSNQQAMSGEIISRKRKEFFKFINLMERKFGDYKFDYAQSVINTERLKEYQGREVAAMNSLIGPHRDDFLFTFNNKDLAKYGSRGEQRTSVLDLKIAEVSFAETILGTRPVLLLDDIFSELDEDHRQHVVDLSKLQQTVIATVEFDKFLKDALKGAELHAVKNGGVGVFS